MLRDSPLIVSLGLAVSSKDSRLTLIRATMLCVHVGTWVVQRCGCVAALCGSALVPGVEHKINLVSYFWLHVSGHKIRHLFD